MNSKESPEPVVGDCVETTYAPTKKRGPVRRLYDWTIHWAFTPYAVWALLVLALAEASFFPIPPDVLLIAMALGAPRKALRYAAVCTVGSVVGAFLGYAIGMFAMDAVGMRVIEFYGLEETYRTISTGFRENGFLYVLAAALTPIPYKVFTIAAGACHLNLGVLTAASVVGRGLRFFAVGALFKLFGPPIQRLIDRYFNIVTIAFMVLLVLGFVLVKIIWSGEPSEPPPQPGAGSAVEEEKPQDETTEKPEEGMLSKQARKKLLEIARSTVEAAVSRKPIPKEPIEDAELQGHQGAFVTLKTHGKLRGCIGRFVADQPLWKTVREMAVASSTEDPRFWGNRLRAQEMGDLEIEISVLSPLEKIANPLDIELGKHGIYIRSGGRAGCFLPQVATETGWSKEEFLSNCCAHKAGMPADAWKDPKTDVLVFTAEIINETEELAESGEQ